MELRRIETPGIAHFAYLLVEGPVAALVDPRRDVDEYLAVAREMGTRITHVIETHRQEDFVMGSAYLAQLLGCSIVNGTHELFGRGDIRLEDGGEFTLGSLTIRALHTPGHTPESMCYAVFEEGATEPWCLFTGDTLFYGDTGRTDLPDADRSEENAALLYDSVHSRLASLGDRALIYPAHGPGSVCGAGMAERSVSTLGQEKVENKVFTRSREEFAREKGGERLPRPPYFRLMEKVNLEGGSPPVWQAGKIPLLTVEDFADRPARTVVFDTREPEAFAGGHIPDSHSIWLGGLPVFGGWMATAEDPVLIVGDRTADIDSGALHLSRIGIDNVSGGLKGGFGTWRNAGRPLRVSGVITPERLHESRDDYEVLDVREPGEFAAGHIAGARSVYVGDLDEQLAELELHADKPVVVTCGVGHRAGLGVSILLRHGYREVYNLLGGMSAWTTLELPVEQGDS